MDLSRFLAFILENIDIQRKTGKGHRTEYSDVLKDEG
jgi:hypothetical protein